MVIVSNSNLASMLEMELPWRDHRSLELPVYILMCVSFPEFSIMTVFINNFFN